MEHTPKKLVHWALDVSMSEFGSPLSQVSSDSTTSTSSLQYINSQLIAHGFTCAPGLSLDGVGNEDMDRVVKCLLGMLSQRVDDMSKTEDLSTNIRTLSYEHERLLSLYKNAKDRSANAEREASTHKSRLSAISQTLRNNENAHKRTTLELQRLRTSLQGLRETHKAEIKKIEKEKDRMTDRWSKLSDSQLKLGSTVPSGIRFANAQVVEASDVQLRGQGRGFMEVALEEAERSRDGLADENRVLRGLILSTANELQRILHFTRNLASSTTQDEPMPFSITSLFPISPADAATEKLTSILLSLRELTEQLALDHSVSRTLPSTSQSLPERPKAQDQTEIDRLQEVIRNLKSELEETKKSSSSYTHQSQALFDRFAADQRLTTVQPRDASVDIMTVPARDEERDRLDARHRDLEVERRKFTEAAVQLGKEKAALEAERITFLEEKRSWQVKTMLSELPPTPAATSSAASTLPPPVPPVLDTLPSTKSPKKTSRKPTHKVKFSAVLKGPSPKKTRASRRSSGFVMSPLSPQSKSKNTTSSSTKNKVNVIPPFETEVIPPALLTKSTASPEFRTTIHADCTNALPSMSEAFVLPPPSPAAKLPPLGSFLTSTKTTPPLAGLDLGIAIPSTTPPDITFTPEGQQSVPAHLLPPSLSFNVSLSSTPAAASPLDTLAPAEPVPEQSSLCVPSTPVPRRPSFPVAKPFAQHMIHAYSPVKPSPLSRILSMADSPEERAPLGHSGPRRGLDTLMEEGQSGSWGISPIPAPSMPDTIPAPLLQGGYGDNHVDEEDDESPLLQRERLRGKKETSSVLPSTRIRTKSTSSSNNATRVRSKSSSSQKLRSEHGRVVAAKKTTAPVHSRERTSSKSRHVASSATTTSKARVVSGGGEKENDKRKKPSSSSSSSSSSSYSSTGAPPATKRPSTSTERALPPAISTQEGSRGINAPTSSISRPAPAPVKKGGARRVPIDSAEAAPTGTAWRG